jgi:hypothetical protein
VCVDVFPSVLYRTNSVVETEGWCVKRLKFSSFFGSLGTLQRERGPPKAVVLLRVFLFCAENLTISNLTAFLHDNPDNDDDRVPYSSKVRMVRYRSSVMKHHVCIERPSPL